MYKHIGWMYLTNCIRLETRFTEWYFNKVVGIESKDSNRYIRILFLTDRFPHTLSLWMNSRFDRISNDVLGGSH